MPNTISVVEINYEDDLVTARQRARQVSRLLTFVEQDQTRISTAVSEIARLFVHSKRPALIEFQIEGTTVPQLLLVDIGWSGAGSTKSGSMLPSNTRDLDPEWESAVTSARRLMDHGDVRSDSPERSLIRLVKILPARAPLFMGKALERIIKQLS